MARGFTNNEAKELISKHVRLIKQLDRIYKDQDKWQNYSALSASKLAQQGTFSAYADMELANSQEYYSDDPEIMGLITDLYTYQQLSALVSQTDYLKRSTIKDIQDSIATLKPTLGSIKWLFTNAQKKADAEEAYYFLSEMLESDYPQRIASIIASSESAENPDRQNVLSHFVRNRSTYQYTLKKNAPDIAWDSIQSSNLEQLLESQRTVPSDLDLCDQAAERSRKHVEDAVIQLSAAMAMKTIREIPVEELKGAKDGLRIKALRDEGYTTLADVYSASKYQLASIRGISDDTAVSIKRYAKKLVEEAQKTTKIKLSADDRTKEATNVVAAVYAYQKRAENIQRYSRLKSQGIEDVPTYIRCLSDLGNGASILFADPSEREQIYKSYSILTWLREHDFERYIRELSNSLNKKLTFTAGEAWDSFQNDSVSYFKTIEDIVPGALGIGDKLYGLPEDLAREIQDEAFFPDGLLCTLRRYQEWGVKYILHQEKVLLGDEMGLGKTIQAIAAMVSLRNTGETHFLVVCPASVITNWFREIRKSSKLRATIIHGAGKKAALREWRKTGGVGITSYETTGIFDNEGNVRVGLIVVDEAHYIKNVNAKRSENVRALCQLTGRILFMSGTALENKVDEMISLIKPLRPDIARTVEGMAFMSKAPQFREAVAPVYYRRKREDVLTELPELIEKEEWCTLLHQEEYIYENSVLSKQYAASRRVSWSVDDPAFSSKALRLKELVEEAASDGRKVLVFSFFLDTIDMVMRTLGDRCVNPINGSITPQQRQEIIDEFDSAPAGTVLPAQIVSGGTGLNIQSASVVIICEPQLKPSIEKQAISRAYRMGQARNVLVFRLLCENTIDERITEMLKEKQKIFDAFADKSVAAQQSLDIDEKTMGSIIQEEIDRINKKQEKENPVHT